MNRSLHIYTTFNVNIFTENYLRSITKAGRAVIAFDRDPIKRTLSDLVTVIDRPDRVRRSVALPQRGEVASGERLYDKHRTARKCPVFTKTLKCFQRLQPRL